MCRLEYFTIPPVKSGFETYPMSGMLHEGIEVVDIILNLEDIVRAAECKILQPTSVV